MEAGTYFVPNPFRRRVTFAIGESKIVLGFFLLCAASTVLAAVVGLPTGNVVAVGLLAAVALVFAVVSLIAHYRDPEFVYTVSGVEVTFQGADYYVPPNRLNALVQAVVQTWGYTMGSEDAKDIYSRVKVTVSKDRPIDPVKRTDKVVGLTYHRAHYSKIWGPYVLDVGGLGYELLLHGAHFYWGGVDEGQKIERMESEGIFDTLRDQYEHNLSLMSGGGE